MATRLVYECQCIKVGSIKAPRPSFSQRGFAILSSCLPKNKQWNYVLALNAGPGREVIKQAVGCYIRQIPQDVSFQRESNTSRSLLQCAQELLKTLFSWVVTVSKWSGDTMENRPEESNRCFVKIHINARIEAHKRSDRTRINKVKLSTLLITFHD